MNSEMSKELEAQNGGNLTAEELAAKLAARHEAEATLMQIEALRRMQMTAAGWSGKFVKPVDDLKAQIEDVKEDMHDFDPMDASDWEDQFNAHLDEVNEGVEINLGGYTYDWSQVFNNLDGASQREIQHSVSNEIDKDKFEEYRDLADKVDELDDKLTKANDRLTAAQQLGIAAEALERILQEDIGILKAE